MHDSGMNLLRRLHIAGVNRLPFSEPMYESELFQIRKIGGGNHVRATTVGLLYT